MNEYLAQTEGDVGFESHQVHKMRKSRFLPAFFCFYGFDLVQIHILIYKGVSMEKYKCEFCDKAFEKFQQKANHVRWYHKADDFYEKTKAKLSAITEAKNAERFGKYVHEKIACNKCDAPVDIKYRPGKRKNKYYCSRSCANSRGPRDVEFKNKVSQKISDLWMNGHYAETTAKNHLKTNKKQRKMFSSKTERHIVDYFRRVYCDDGWTFGGGLYMDNSTHISRDLYSDKLKVCIEYDGIWHFKDIHGQLEKKQHKDQLLEDWCKNNGYRLIRIDEAAYTGVEQIVDLVYNQSDMLIKVGSRY